MSTDDFTTLDIYQHLLDENSVQRIKDRKRDARPTVWYKGFIYVIYCPTDFYKIGRAYNVERRLATAQIGCPYTLQIICAIPCDRPAQAEISLHARYASHRIRGEWFELSSHELDYLKALAYWRDGKFYTK